MPPKGVVKKATQIQRFYRPGVALAQDRSESEEDSSDEEEEQQPARPPPKASSFPAGKKLGFDLSKASNQSTAAAKAQQDAKKPSQPEASAELEGYVTASESEGEDDSDDDSDRVGGRSHDESSDEEEDSSSDDEPAKLVRPVFVSKAKRAAQNQHERTAEDRAYEEEARQKERADEVLREKMEREAAERAAGKAWDEEEDPVDDLDDTDGVNPEEEHAAWKLRELKRVRRDRHALIEKEKEREEVERRRNMTAEEREKEDEAFIAAQKEEQEGRGKMGNLQRYVHKGAFYQADDDEMDEDVREAMNRDLTGATFEDDVQDKSALPEYMQIRDMSRLGRSGRTKYKDLRSEDTGTWGQDSRPKREFNGADDRFRNDGFGGGSDRTGANNAPVGERRKREDDGAGQGKRQRVD